MPTGHPWPDDKPAGVPAGRPAGLSSTPSPRSNGKGRKTTVYRSSGFICHASVCALAALASERGARCAPRSPSEAAEGGGSGPQGGAQGCAPVRRQHRMCCRRTPGTRSGPGGPQGRKARTSGCPCLGYFYDSGHPALRPSGRLRRSNAFPTHLWASNRSDSAGFSRTKPLLHDLPHW